MGAHGWARGTLITDTQELSDLCARTCRVAGGKDDGGPLQQLRQVQLEGLGRARVDVGIPPSGPCARRAEAASAGGRRGEPGVHSAVCGHISGSFARPMPANQAPCSVLKPPRPHL